MKKVKKSSFIFIGILIAIIVAIGCIMLKNKKNITTQVSDYLEKGNVNLWHGSYYTYTNHGTIYLFGYGWSGDEGYGWCMKQGRGVTDSPTSYSNMYNSNYKLLSGDKNKINWLCENIVAYTTNTTELNYYKQYWKQHYNVDFTGYDMKRIFNAEQYVLWHYTNGISMKPGTVTSSERYKIISLANQMISVVNNKVGSNYTWISTPQSKVSIAKGSYNGATKVATFKVKNAIKLNIVEGSGKIYTDENCTKEYVNGTFIKEGTVYVKVSSGNKIKVKAIGYKTKSAYYYNCGNKQPVFTNKKTEDEKTAELSTEIKGSYKINIVKKDANSATAVNNYTNAIAGATFKVQRYLNNGGGLTGTSETKNIYSQSGKSVPLFGGSTNITSTSADRYQIKELYAPDGYTKPLNANGVELDWTIGLQVHKKIEGTEYKVSKITFLGNNLKADKTDITPGQVLKVKKDGTVEINSNTTDYMLAICFTNQADITVVWKDPQIKPINIKVVKKSTDGTNPAAKFTLKQGSNILMNNTTINSKGYTVDVEKNTDYLFDFYETSAPLGYKNIFNNDSYAKNAKIQFKVKVGSNGKPSLYAYTSTRNYTTVALDSSKSVNTSMDFYKNISVNIQNREITITVTDPRDTTYFELFLDKYEFNSNFKRVGGAKFSACEVNANGVIIENLGTITSENNTRVKVARKDNILLGESHTYYYRIIEEKAPENYVRPGFIGAIVKITVDERGNISKEIVKIQTIDGSWHLVSGISAGSAFAKWSNYIKVDKSQKNIEFSFYDSVAYEFEVIKKNYAGGLTLAESEDFSGNASFKIEDLSQNNEIIFDDYLVNSRTLISEKEAKSNTTYKYRITETSVSDDYYDTLVNKPIILEIRLDSNGKLQSSWGTKWYFENLTTAEKNILNKFVDIKVDANNRLNVYIANMPKNYYAVELIKVDNNNNVITNSEAEFYVKQESTNPNTTTGYELGTTTKGVKTTKGILNIAKKNLREPRYKHSYTIKETNAPAGYLKLNGNIKLDLSFTDKGEIEESSISCKYFNAQNQEENLKGLQMKYDKNTGIPLISIYVPNDTSLYEFELQKQDLEGNLVKSEFDNNGNIDGAIFNITRTHFNINNPNSNISTEAANALAEKFGGSLMCNEYLESGKVSEKIPLYSHLTYIYTIKEVSSKSNFVNIFEKYQFIVSIKTTIDTNTNKPILESANYQVIDTENHGNNATERFKQLYGSFVELKVDSANNKVTMIIKNSPGYKIRLNKADSNGNLVDNAAVIEAYKINGDNEDKVCVLEAVKTATSTESFAINKNEEHVFRVYEKAAITPYYNLFGDDKYIEIRVKMNEQGNMEVVNYTIKNSYTNVEIPTDELNKLKKYIEKVEFIKENNDHILNVVIKNPKKYRLRITKYKPDGQTELSGATISVNGKKIINDGTSSYYEDVIELGSTKQYKITEENTLINHINILKGKYILLNTQLVNDNIEYSYGIYNSSNNEKISEVDEVYNNVFIYTSTDNDKVNTINIKIINPSSIKFELTKVNTAENALNNVEFTVNSPIVKSQNGRYSNLISKVGVVSIDEDTGDINCKTNAEGKFSFEEMNMPVGIYEYEIQETYVESPYVNMFNDYKIYVKVQVNEDGTISLVKYSDGKNFEIRNAEGTKAANNYYALVKQVYIDSSTSIQCVKVIVKNPVEFVLKINKQIFGKDESELNLGGTVFEVKTPSGTKEVTTDANGNITLPQENISEGTYEYTIKEKSVPSVDIVNILSDNMIKIKLYVSADGKVYTIKNSNNEKTKNSNNEKTKNSYFICDKNGVNISFANTKIDDFVSVNVSDEKINAVNVKILDPQKYNIKIIKKDAETDERLNNVVFNAKVYECNSDYTTSNEIKLKDANTLNDKNLTGLITKNVNDVDGIIEINDILFEKEGNYKIVLSENEVEGYKKIGDVTIKYTVNIVNKKYKLNNFGVEGAMDVINPDVQKIIDATDKSAAIMQIPVDNTPLNGDYEIEIQKVDSELNSIEGVLFTSTSEQVKNANRTKIPTDGEGMFSVTNGKVDIVYEQKETLKENESKVNTIDTYTIEEVDAGTKYQKLKNRIIVTVEKEKVNNEYKIKTFTVREENTGNSVPIDSIPNTAILSNVQLENSSETVDLTIGVDDKSKITIQVPNKEQYGEYEIDLYKKKSDNSKLSNIPFKINEVEKHTDADGYIKVTKDKSSDGSGIVKITNENVKIPDTYKIEELYDETYTKDFVILGAPITLTVNKNPTITENGYVLSNVTIDHTTKSGPKTTVVNLGESKSFPVLMANGENKMMSITVSNSCKVELRLINPDKKGEYSLQIQKININSDGDEEALNGVSFAIFKNGTGIGTVATGDAGEGYTDKVGSNITVDNVNITDKYTISEKTVEIEEGIVKLKNNLQLTVTKGINNAKNGYTIKTVKLEELNRNNATQEIAIEEGKTISKTLNGVELQDGRTVNVDITVGIDSNIIIKARNRSATGEYKIKIKKIDEATEEVMGGVTFRGLDYKKMPISATTPTSGNDKGIAIIDENNDVNISTAFTYVLWESAVPEGYLLLSDFQLVLSFKTKLNDNKTKYIVDKSSIDLQIMPKGGSATTNIQREIIEKTTFDVQDNTIIITVNNRKTTDYDLSIIKHDLETNASLADAMFTIKENGITIIDNKKISEFPENALVKHNIPADQTIKYEIYENKAATGHDNIFVTDDYSTHLLVKVVLDKNGNATATYDVIADSGNRTAAVNTVKGLINAYKLKTGTEIISKNSNSFTLNIPNPRSSTRLKLTLNKHQLNSTKGVDGAVFGIRRIHVEKEKTANVDNIITQFAAGTNVTELQDITTSADVLNLSIDTIENAKVEDTYYYEIYEKNVPSNFMTKYRKVIVRAHINEDKTITSSIVAISTQENNNWVAYNEETHSDRITLTSTNEEIKLNWSNEVRYMVMMLKRFYKNSLPKESDGSVNWGKTAPLVGAKFTLKQVLPNEKTIWNKEVVNGEKYFFNEEANTLTTYKYEITEEETIEGYYNIFKGVKMYLYVKTDKNGNVINSANDTRIEIDEKSPVSAETLKLAKESLEVIVDGNTVNLYIANKAVNTKLDISILKVANKKYNGAYQGVPGIKFSILGPNQLPIRDPETNEDYVTDINGNINIPDLEITGGKQIYRIVETEAPEGVTKLENSEIVLTIDTTGMESSLTKEEVAEMLNTPKEDGSSRVNVVITPTGAGGLSELENLKATIFGTTIALTIPNPTGSYTFNLFKKDPIGGLVSDSDHNGAAEFRVATPTSETKLLLDGQLSNGFVSENVITKANTEYVYKIEETKSKPGFINVLEGWDLYVHIATDANGNVRPTENNGIGGVTHYNLVAKENEIQKYDLETIIRNNYIRMNTESVDRHTDISISIINPFEYRVQLDKTDLNGVTPVNKATITAEKVDSSRIEELYYAGSGDYGRYNKETVSSILSEIATDANHSETVTLNKQYTILSDEILIENNIGMAPKKESGQIWRITENDVSAPYMNILKDKYIVVQTYFREYTLKIAEHHDFVNNEVKKFNFYVTDREGNDYTAEYEKYVEVSIENVNGEYRLIVKVKDPMKFYVDLYKVENDDNNTPLEGAQLELSLGDNKSNTNGKSHTDSLFTELAIGRTTTFSISEDSTVNGHINILKDKVLIFIVRNNNGIMQIITTNLIDKTNGRIIDGQEKEFIMKHITTERYTTDDGFTGFHVYVRNPIEYKFNLRKFDTSNNLLEGAQIRVVSSHSGTHYLNRNSSMEFTETDLTIGKTIVYNITEENTVENSAYVNVFKGKTITVVVKVQDDGSVRILQAFTSQLTDHGSELIDIKELGFADYNTTGPDDDGLYTVNLMIQNPTQIDFEVIKKSSGPNPIRIENTKFTVESSFSNTHTEYTDENGDIIFRETPIKSGEYEYTITEDEVANANYVNILEGVYIKEFIKVYANGNISFNQEKLGKTKPYKVYSKVDDAEVTDSRILSRIYKYVTVGIDTSDTIQKLVVTVKDPITIDVNVIKTEVDGTVIPGTNFTIESQLAGAITKDTDDNGSILINEEFVDPGVYRYVITENNSAEDKYYNILKDSKIIMYIKVSESGLVSMVADETGNSFPAGTKDRYYIEKLDGSQLDSETEEEIRKHIHIRFDHVNNDNDGVEINIENTLNYQLNIIKTDKEDKDLSGSKFTVYRDDKLLLNNVDITTETEITEENMNEGIYTYYITENQSEIGHINLLEGKFIKVYTNLKSNGVLKVIEPEEYAASPNYYEIYQGNIANRRNAKYLDKTEYAELYDSISVESKENANGMYTLNVKVKNPDRNVRITLNKKLFGYEKLDLANTKFTIKSEFSGDHILTTDSDGNLSFEEKQIPEGYYKYEITETESAGPEIINILDKMSIFVTLKVNQDGTVVLVGENRREQDGVYYLFESQEHSSVLTKVDFEQTVVDNNYIRVGTSRKDDMSELNIYVSDPQFYNFELIKADKDTNERMNGVTFTLHVYNEDDEEVELIDAETLEKIVGNKVKTKNVNGVDGVISIPNILINKSGMYTYVFHEESTDGIFEYLYKSLATNIRVDVKIGVKKSNGSDEFNRYEIESTTISQGENYVEKVSTSETKAQTSSVKVVNERIKGSYDLVLNKIDSYTKKKLDGAEFEITVEKDGQPYELYKSTDDVTSKDVIIPGTYITKGGKITIPDIRIDRPETYTITLKETKAPITPDAPNGYMLLDEPIVIEVSTGRSGIGDDEKFVLEYVEMVSGKNHGLVEMDYNEESINIIAKNEYFDLALRKSIETVSYADNDDGKITKEDTEDRIPEEITTKLLANEETTADYNHVKNHVRAYASQEVIYTLRVYNEGEIDGYAEEITDHLPEWLDFVDDDFNKERGWKLDPSDPTLKTVKTTYLSKDNNPNNDAFNDEKNLIRAMDKVTGELDHKEIQIRCRISDDAKAKTVLTNIAEISLSKANNRTSETVDRDSVTNNVNVPETSEDMSNYQENNLTDDRNTYIPGQEDDDDFEKLIIEEFDFALRKYIAAVNDEPLTAQQTENIDEETKDNDENTEENDNEETEDESNTDNEEDIIYEREPVVNVDSLKNGSSTTATYTHPKDPVEVSVGDIVTYTLAVYNEGTVDGYATLIKDTIPEGLEFVKDSEINKKYRWKIVDENDEETDDITKAKYVVSDYLSKENGEDNLIKAFNGESLEYKFVQVDFKVIVKQDWSLVIKNQAQIAEDSDENGKPVTDRDSTPNEWKGEDDEDEEFIRVTYMDLALRKFITGVNDKEVTERIPQVDATALINETATTAEYKHPKDPVLVHTTDVVTYTIRVYNEGSKDGYATGVKDDIPQGLEFLPDHEINKKYGWKLVDKDDKLVSDVTKAKYVVTNYLSKENEKEKGQNLLKAFDKETMKEPDFRDVKIAFKVVEPTTSDRIVINQAQISEQTDGKGIHRDDRDSTPNEWKGEDDEDIEKVRVQYFDLALRKWVTKAIVIENGQTNVTETGHHAEDDPEEVVKVDLKKKKLNSVVVKFEYQIRITNEGEIAGYAKEIKDYIPEGLVFEAIDNPSWVQVEDRVITTDQLKDRLLQPGESAEVTVILTWVNSETNMGVKVNVAEISKDYNDYETPDIDSTPNNKVPGEDDIDDAPVMLTIKTGSEYLRYMAITLGVLAILGLGVSLIKDEVKRKK